MIFFQRSFNLYFNRLKARFLRAVVKVTSIPSVKGRCGKTVQLFFVGLSTQGTNQLIRIRSSCNKMKIYSLNKFV